MPRTSHLCKLPCLLNLSSTCLECPASFSCLLALYIWRPVCKPTLVDTYNQIALLNYNYILRKFLKFTLYKKYYGRTHCLGNDRYIKKALSLLRAIKNIIAISMKENEHWARPTDVQMQILSLCTSMEMLLSISEPQIYVI